MSQKRFAKIVIIGIVVTILLSVVGYFILVKQTPVGDKGTAECERKVGSERNQSVGDKGTAECERKVGSERNQCFRDLAIAREDGNLCENAGELKGVCLQYIAIYIKKDPNLCEKIPSGSLGASREECRKTILFKLSETKETCLEHGGTWRRIGMNPVERCNFRTSDVGKACTDSTQCEDSCIGENISATIGKCSEWRITVGCHALLQDGKVPGIICAD